MTKQPTNKTKVNFWVDNESLKKINTVRLLKGGVTLTDVFTDMIELYLENFAKNEFFELYAKFKQEIERENK